MYKKIFHYSFLTFVVFLLLLFLSGCSNQSSLIGYWISGDGNYSVSFDENNTIVVDDKFIGKYNAFSEGKIAINVDTSTFDEHLDISMSAEYTIHDDTLIITDIDTNRSFYYYTEEKVNKTINNIYKSKHAEYNGIREFSLFDDLGHFDDTGDLVKYFDWYIEEGDNSIYQSHNQSIEIFKEEVLSYYNKKSPSAKYQIIDNGIMGVEGTILFGIELRREGEGTISLVNKYAIEPTEKLIYIHDIVHDSYELWNGTTDIGKSLFVD